MSIIFFINFALPTFFFNKDCRDFQCMFFCFVAGSKWWIQLSSPVMTHPITSGSSSAFSSYLRHILVRWSLCSRVRKWGTLRAATPHFQFLAQNHMDRRFWNIRSSRKLLNSDVTIFSWEAMQRFLWLWRRPYVDRRLSILQAIPRQRMLRASTSPSPLRISLTDYKILSYFYVHFSHPFSNVRINNFYKNRDNSATKSDNEVKLWSLI